MWRQQVQWKVIGRELTEFAEKLVVEPIKKLEGTVKLPGSKSLSNRTLLLASLSRWTSVVQNVLVRWISAFGQKLPINGSL